MKRTFAFFVSLLFLLLAFSAAPASAAEASGYAGEWVCVAIDMGDGVRLTQYEGSAVADLMKIRFDPDGSLQVTSFGQPVPGIWEPGLEGVSAVIDGSAVIFRSVDGELVNASDGVTFYLEKAATAPKAGGLLSLVKASRYAGEWVASGIDEGDGVIRSELNGVKAADLLSFSIGRDGMLVMTSMGLQSAGAWREIDGGINVLVDGVSTDMMLEEDRLVAESEGATIYFIRSGQPQADAPSATPPAASLFEGIWNAVRFETAGSVYDAALLFQDGCAITLLKDGTGTASVTKDYSERLTWSEKDGTLTLGGSHVFTSPSWDAETGELTLGYAMGTVSVVFIKIGVPLDEKPPLSSPQPAPGPASTPEPTREPTLAPTSALTAVPAAKGEEQLCETALFTARFPAGWVLSEGSLYDRADYCAVKYALNDPGGRLLASIYLTVSSEDVGNYRDKIRLLGERALSGGKDALEEIQVGGLPFRGAAYESWGSNYAEYAARVPASRITVSVTLESPENIAGLQAMLDSIVFTLPALTPPNIDPPLPEDGVPYRPLPASACTDAVQLSARWLRPEEPIVLNEIFDNHIALQGDRLYALTGDTLRAFSVVGDSLVSDRAFAGGAVKLDDEYEYLSAPREGPLYLSEGLFTILAVRDGAVAQANDLSGDLVMHPSGEWGISFWANADPMRVSATDGILAEEPWVLSGISDAGTRQGRFSSISCVSISEDRVYVAGTDAQRADANRVAVFDLSGTELFSFGADDWTADDAFGSVTGIAEVPQGILVLDGNYRDLKLYTAGGEFIGKVGCDALLGTSYPWPSSMVPSENGVMIAVAQEREDKSCEELLIFEVTVDRP